MRAVLLVLMIALLPLRAWLGDSMAMQLDIRPSTTIEIIATSADPVRARATFSLNFDDSPLPCHESASATANDLIPHGDCADCSLCQICHSVALTAVISPLPLLALPTQAVQSGQTLFASVPRAPHIKPPIA